MSQYKVFLCHNSNDKPEVRQIREQLRQPGIYTWMDEKNLYGFDDWKEKIKENLSQINAVAVFLGSSGFGEWQKYEIIYTQEEISRRQNKKLFTLKQETTLRVGLVILPSCQHTFQEIQNQYYKTPYGWLFNYHTVDLRTSNAPMQQLIGAIKGQPWQVDDLSSETGVNYTRLRDLLKAGLDSVPRLIKSFHLADFREKEPNPMEQLIWGITGQKPAPTMKVIPQSQTQNTPQNQRDDLDDDLSSETGVNYTRLRDLLKAGQWEQADQETLAVMLKATGREKERWLSSESIENFPCTDLRTIDQLWVKYSEGRFGFSVQKRIWERVGKDYEKFGDRVGWRRIRESSGYWLSLDQLTFSNNALQGHLPVVHQLWKTKRIGWVEFLASTLQKCNI